MSKPIHMPGPALIESHTVYALNGIGTNSFSANVEPDRHRSAKELLIMNAPRPPASSPQPTTPSTQQSKGSA